MVDILLLGATGFTGRLAARYLAQHPQRRTSSAPVTNNSFTFAVSGRSPSKLNELVVSLGLGDDVEVIVLDTTNDRDVETAVKRARVVINCVGPFWRLGFGVVRACAANGVHYIDITGETPYVYEVINRYDYLAYKNNSIIIPSCGFDSLPSDIIVHVAASTLRKALAPPQTPNTPDAPQEAPTAFISTSKTSFKVFNAVFSGGTLSSILCMLTDIPNHMRSKTVRTDCLSPVKRFTSTLNSPSLVYTLIPSFSPQALYKSLASITSSTGRKTPFSRWGSFFLLSPHNRAIVNRSWGLLERESAGWNRDTTVHHPHNGNANANTTGRGTTVRTYGVDFSYDEFAAAKGPISAFMTSVVFLGGIISLAIFPPMRWLFAKLSFKPGEGPSEEAMAKSSMFLTNVTTSVPIQTDIHKTPRSCIVKTTIEVKREPGYTGSAIMSSEVALSLLNVPSLPPLAQHGGVLTPATALGDVIVRRLSDTGFWEVRSEVVQHPDD